MQFIENKTFDEIKIGDEAQLTRTLQKEDIDLFAVLSGDANPTHVDDEFARTDSFHRVVAHGMWGGALISAVLGTELPGPGAVYVSQSLKFRAPVRVGDTVQVRATVKEIIAAKGRVILETVCSVGDTVVLEGEAHVLVGSRAQADAAD